VIYIIDPLCQEKTVFQNFQNPILRINLMNITSQNLWSGMIDMLLKAKDKKKELTNQKNLEYILADINHIPLKNNSIDHIVSVSAYNFITYNKKDSNEKIKIINNTATYLNTILKTNGRIVIEFYPQNDEELKLFSSSFINNGFQGYIIKQNPNQKGGQTFLLLKKC